MRYVACIILVLHGKSTLDFIFSGLADTLHSELMLYGIDVHIYFPATMYTPGFDQENQTKPEIVRRIESTDEGQTPDQAAQALYNGVVDGHAHITGDLLTALFSASTRGAVRRNNSFLDGLYDFIAYVSIYQLAPQMSGLILGECRLGPRYGGLA